MVLNLETDISISGREVRILASYDEIIRAQSSRMDKPIKWWPHYLYHFTDVNHAVSIIASEWIYDRTTVKEKKLTKTDAASQNVLNVTGDAVKHCGRLYMRPLTPPQFYMEGYKPKAVRYKDYKDANCPVPVFFLLDPVKTLNYPDVFFVECGAAGKNPKPWKSGADEYAKMNLEKIFHDGPTGHDTSILKYRRTEVLRNGGIPLRDLLIRIVCRSQAETDTLRCLIRRQCPVRYEEYSRFIMTALPDVGRHMFFNHGIYLKAVNAKEDQAILEFNEAKLRYDYSGEIRKGGVPVSIIAVLSWKNEAGQIIDRSTCQGMLDYKTHNAVVLNYGHKPSNYFTLEVQLDENLVFLKDFDIENQSIIF